MRFERLFFPPKPKLRTARRVPFRHLVPMADVGPLLRLRGVCKSFGGIQAVHSITFDVAPGESVGLVGPNGAGKTTLFNCVCGQLRPEEGDIVFDGQVLVGHADLQACPDGHRAHLPEGGGLHRHVGA